MIQACNDTSHIISQRDDPFQMTLSPLHPYESFYLSVKNKTIRESIIRSYQLMVVSKS